MRPHKAALGSITGSLGRSWGSAPCNACLGLLGNAPMRSPRYDRILASTALSLMLATPLGAFAQDSEELAATFNERFPADQTSTQPYLEIQKVKKERRVTTTTTRAVTVKRPRSHVVVAPRSFLNAGCCRVNANSSITLSRQPMLRWTWSAILAVAAVGTIRPCRVPSCGAVVCIAHDGERKNSCSDAGPRPSCICPTPQLNANRLGGQNSAGSRTSMRTF